MLISLFYSKATTPVVSFFRFTSKKNLFNFIKKLHYFTLVTAFSKFVNSKVFTTFFKVPNNILKAQQIS